MKTNLKTIAVDLDVICHYRFDDGFECALDHGGIIWIKHKNEKFQRPCMKLCFDTIKQRNIFVANYILNQSCLMQDDNAITERAEEYKKY